MEEKTDPKVAKAGIQLIALIGATNMLAGDRDELPDVAYKTAAVYLDEAEDELFCGNVVSARTFATCAGGTLKWLRVVDPSLPAFLITGVEDAIQALEDLHD